MTPPATPVAPAPPSPAQRAAEGAWDGLRGEVEAELRHPVMASTGSGEVSADLLRRCLAALARVEAERDAAWERGRDAAAEVVATAPFADDETDLFALAGRDLRLHSLIRALRAPGEGRGDG